MAKSERASELGKIVKKILTDEVAVLEGWSKELVDSVVNAYKTCSSRWSKTERNQTD
jgi:polyribonucleotide nucleotidyltransferase